MNLSRAFLCLCMSLQEELKRRRAPKKGLDKGMAGGIDPPEGTAEGMDEQAEGLEDEEQDTEASTVHTIVNLDLRSELVVF
jgi:hypothetical protein